MRRQPSTASEAARDMADARHPSPQLGAPRTSSSGTYPTGRSRNILAGPVRGLVPIHREAPTAWNRCFDRQRAVAMIRLVSVLTLALAFLSPAAAQWPERPVRLIVPYSAGGSTDLVARLVAARMTERIGQQFVVDNRTGAGTLIGTEIGARATPDGHTLLMATPPLVVNPSLRASVPYDLERDFVAITNVAGSSNLLAVHPSVPSNTTKELISL